MNLEGHRLSAHSIQHSQDINVKKMKPVPSPPAGTHDSTKDLMFHLIETEVISPFPETSTTLPRVTEVQEGLSSQHICPAS